MIEALSHLLNNLHIPLLTRQMNRRIPINIFTRQTCSHINQQLNRLNSVLDVGGSVGGGAGDVKGSLEGGGGEVEAGGRGEGAIASGRGGCLVRDEGLKRVTKERLEDVWKTFGRVMCCCVS